MKTCEWWRSFMKLRRRGLMKIAFYKADGDWLDKLIRWFTWATYTHCEIIFSCNRSFSSSERDWWVRFKEINYIEDHWDIIDLNIWKYTEDIMFSQAYHEVWKWYDWTWILFTHIIKLNKQDKNKWFCSEICWHLLWYNNSHRLTPQDLYHCIQW